MDRLNSPYLSPGNPGELCELPALPFALGDRPAAADPSPQERVARIVRTIEADIIPRLVRAHRAPAAPERAATGAAPQPTPQEVETFVGHVLDDQDAAWTEMVDRLRERGSSVDRIYLELLGPAARLLGRMWEDDRCMFSDVTVAVGRLQRIMRALSPAFGSEVDHPADGRRVLLVPDSARA